jgi:type II secretory pathway component PulF
MGKPVPTTIAVLSSLAALIESHLVPAGLALAIVVGALWAGGARELARTAKRTALGLPAIGEAMKWAATRHFAATLHLYITSGQPVALALPNALTSAGFPIPEERLHLVSGTVRAGSTLASALLAFGLFPDKFVHMVEIGESSGRLAEVLASAAGEAKAKAEQRLALISALLAPILILIIGGLVGAVIFSVFSSLLQINELVA